MRVETLSVRNFRAVRQADISFSDVTVFSGINGAGKTTLLECLSLLLARAVAAAASGRAAGKNFDEEDISLNEGVVWASISSSYNGIAYTWDLERIKTSRSQRLSVDLSKQDLGGARDLGKVIRESLIEDFLFSVPLVVLYPVNRSVIEIPLRIKKKSKRDQLSAYNDALGGGSRNFRFFFEWFRDREDLENENRIDDHNYRDHELNAVREAVSCLMPGFNNLRIRRNPLRMMVDKNGQEIRVDYLSDGEKIVLALAGDLARRLAIANPALDDPRHGRGIVLIDEIELHLHPSWQRKVIHRLKSAFPNCQFIVTTHSPLVISEIHHSNVYQLRNGVVEQSRRRTYGRPAGEVLEDVMEVSRRPEKVEQKLSDLFEAIDDDEADQAARLLRDLENEIGHDDADLVRARLMARRFGAP